MSQHYLSARLDRTDTIQCVYALTGWEKLCEHLSSQTRRDDK